MKNTATIVLVVAALVIGGAGLYALVNRDSSMKKADSMEKTESVEKTDETMMKNESSYAPFSPELLTGSAGTRRVLFFYASWCPTCKPADTNFTKNMAQIPADVTLIRVNYNDTDTDQAEKELAKKYGVTYQHTFVQIDAQGNELAKWNGGQIDELLRNLK